MDSIDDLFPLSDLSEGEEAIIREIKEGMGKGHGKRKGLFRQEYKKRLCDLGLIPGTSVRMLSHNNHTYLIEVRGVRYGVGRGLVNKIMVSYEKD
ncbi:MAG: ferrous iron transport protein A [Nanoarchaeota archaeon]|nr:ferrous iron transport protein A [Nanoarchaeota archaeon]